jgi:hypothetical protein
MQLTTTDTQFVCKNTLTTTRIVIENPSLVTQVYSGKPGCCCGCKGKYSEGAAAVKAHATRTNALLADGGVNAVQIAPDCGVFIYTDTRQRNIYINPETATVTKRGDLIIIRARATA